MSTLDNLRKRAKRWLKALRNGDLAARDRLRRAHPRAPDNPTLRDVQHAVARERGYESWTALTSQLDADRPAAPRLTALLAAANKGDAAVVAAILDEHPDIINERGLLPGHTGLRTALHFGVQHEAVVRLLLERGADPNIRDEGDHAFPIHFAAERGDLTIVKLLIEHGADPIGADTLHELDVLGWAICFDDATHTDVAQYLLAHGARHTLFSAVAIGDVDAIRRLAQEGADLNRRMDRTNRQRTPLHLAIEKQQPQAVAALIELGADPNLEDASGLTPIDEAALKGAQEMTERLIDGGARITLASAIVLERPDELERLVAANPDLLVNNRQWARLIVHASGRASGRVMETLLRAAMRHRAGLTIVNMEDDEDTAVDGVKGYTPLHGAAFHGNNEAVAVLLKHGANPRVRDGKYCGTPAGWARYAGHTATADLIVQSEIDIFDAIDADRGDRVAQILDRDPGAIDRPFKAYSSCGSREGQWWPVPDCPPLQWALTEKKEDAVRVLIERGAATRTPDDIQRAERIVTFLKSACWDHHVHGKGEHRMYDRAAQRLLAQHPDIARDSIYTAVVCGELQEVVRILDERPEAAREPGGPRGWTPLLCLCYARFTHRPATDNSLAMARLLLDHGANPNDFYMAGDSAYTALVGVAGEGEQDAPRQPHADALFDLLLERGASPFDIQVLYNTHFSGDVLWFLELVHKRTITTSHAAAWNDPDWSMLDMGGYGCGARFLLETALKKRDLRLAEWLLAHGANPNAAPARDKRRPKGTLYEEALRQGFVEMAELLARHGATTTAPVFTDHEKFMQACFRVDRDQARAILEDHPEFLQLPDAMFAAAERDRPDVLALLLDLGVPIEIRDAHNQRPLHQAAAHNAQLAARFLLERGAEIDPRESRYGGPPIGWAAHADHADMVAFLSKYSRHIWTLCFRGFVERVRDILMEDPSLAKQIDKEGITPLWWLPDDETRAMEIVELLLAAGADPSIRSHDGRTAAEWARRRGMLAVAARLSSTPVS